MRRCLISRLGAVAVAALLGSVNLVAQGQSTTAGQQATRPDPASVPTPRRANGVPDFSGLWIPPRTGGGFAVLTSTVKEGEFTNLLRGRTANPVDFERDAGIRQRVFPRDSKPIYKPQHWDRVKFNDTHGQTAQAPDPEFLCMPAGVPRIGVPQEILQTDRHMVFLYPLHVRRIYIDGRPHPPEEKWIGTWLGHSVGRWEGDTLVISTVDFNGLEWLGWPGWFTSPDKKVMERMRRVGNTLTWEATVEDTLLRQPWKTGPIVRELNPDPAAQIEEPLPCVERDLQHMVTRERG
jgi:hypothetical protein